MVRLVWFPGYMDWERRKYTWEIRGQNADFRGARSFARCVSLVSLLVLILVYLQHCCTFFLASSYLAAGVQAVTGDDAFHTESPIAASVLRAGQVENAEVQKPKYGNGSTETEVHAL